MLDRNDVSVEIDVVTEIVKGYDDQTNRCIFWLKLVTY